MGDVHITGECISRQECKASLHLYLQQFSNLRRVLLLPPDITRGHSLAGMMVQLIFELLPGAEIGILPALGTHAPMISTEKEMQFGELAHSATFYDHNWRNDVASVGEIPEEFVHQVSGGALRVPIDVAINRRLLDPNYDLILSIGQVVPHEVAGMANYTKNVVVGCGGKDFIDKSHFLGAVCGMESIMGRADNPVRMLFDYAEEHFLGSLPLQYILTVTETAGDSTSLKGLFCGRSQDLFHQACQRSQAVNLNLLDRPIKKAVVYLDPQEFKTTWLGNKAIYRTRMAMADCGELIIIAPGVKAFGEDQALDNLLRKFGYKGREHILQSVHTDPDLACSLSAAAHLIHGSSDGRFRITYAVEHLSQAEVEGVGFSYLPYSTAVESYPVHTLENGWNSLGGEEIFFVSNPALGLWALQNQFGEVL